MSAEQIKSHSHIFIQRKLGNLKCYLMSSADEMQPCGQSVIKAEKLPYRMTQHSELCFTPSLCFKVKKRSFRSVIHR